MVVAMPAGGEVEAHEAYEEAYNAIFALQLQCHRHIQPHFKKEGILRWEMIEMWPMQVGKPTAVTNYSLSLHTLSFACVRLFPEEGCCTGDTPLAVD